MILTLDCVFKGEGDDGDIESVEFPKCVVASNWTTSNLVLSCIST